MKKRLVLGLTLLLLFGFAQSQEPPKPKAPDQKAKTSQRGSEQSPIFVKTPRPSTQAERDYEAYEKHEKPENERWTTRATVALAGITLGLAIFTALLWNATRKLVTDAKDTAQRQLRAYVFYRPDLPIHIPNMNELHTTGVKFRIHNSGQTPAYDLRHVTLIGLRERSLSIVLHPVDFPEDGSRVALNPGMHSEQVMKTDLPYPQADIDRFRAGTHAVYIWGEARFRDTFGAPQWVRYAFQITGEGDASGNIQWCRYGNEAS